jgi:aspartate-semialdehyde dehydrogenase
MERVKVAVVGATGLVGRTIISVLEERRFPVGELRLLATERSAGSYLTYAGEQRRVLLTTPETLAGIDFAFFAVGTEASRVLVPMAVRGGAIAVDKSNAFRMDPQVPLVVPEVNPRALDHHQGIIASPNCTTIQCVVALRPIADAAGLARVFLSSYQAVSGSGRGGMDELRQQSEAMALGQAPAVRFYPRQIAGNVIPHIDSFGADGYTGEERKMIAETRKILMQPDLPVAATAVRVPVPVSHAVTVVVETQRPLSRAEARERLAGSPGVRLVDDPATARYPTPADAAGQDDVLVGRIREVPGMPRTLEMWVVADNLRKGAATNAVQIAERLLGRK